jgi:hypothetical protein
MGIADLHIRQQACQPNWEKMMRKLTALPSLKPTLVLSKVPSDLYSMTDTVPSEEAQASTNPSS